MPVHDFFLRRTCHFMKDDEKELDFAALIVIRWFENLTTPILLTSWQVLHHIPLNITITRHFNLTPWHCSVVSCQTRLRWAQFDNLGFTRRTGIIIAETNYIYTPYGSIFSSVKIFVGDNFYRWYYQISSIVTDEWFYPYCEKSSQNAKFSFLGLLDQ